MRRPSLSLLLVLVSLVAQTSPAGTSEGSESAASTDARLQALEREQADLHGRLKEQLDRMEDSPRREELKRRFAEIERRMGSRKLYLPPSARMTEEMLQYHSRMTRKIEECGTRNFPKQNGKSVYGKGILAVTLDRSGKALGIEIVETSGKKFLDSHMSRVVRSSAPFGPLPSRVLAERERPFEQLVVFTRFDFARDDAPVPVLEDKERCRWQ
jgi:protein TonB